MSQNWPGQEIQPAGGASTVKPVVAVGVSPDKAADNARADNGLANDNVRTKLAVEGRDLEKGKVKFDQIKTLREEYGKNPEVRSYRVAVGELAKALKTSPNPQGDLSLVYSFSKAMDPDSVVRDAEADMVVESQPWFQARVEQVKKQFGMDGSGMFSDEARAALRQELIRATAQRNTIYNARRGEYEDFAKRNGFDPYEVVGRHDGELFIDTAREYDQQRREAGANVGGIGGQQTSNSAPPPPTGVTDPALRGGLPVGTEIGFGDADGKDWWDRTAWLQNTYGITPDQEQMIIAFGNQNLGAYAQGQITPEQIAAWYQSKGIKAPPPAVIKEFFDAHVKDNAPFGSFDDSADREAYRLQLKGVLDKGQFDPTSMGAYSDRVMQGALGNLGDELSGVIGGIDAATSNQGIGTGYTTARDAARYALEQERAAQGWTGTGLEIGGGAVTGALLPGGAVRQGATAGAIAGFGSGDGLRDSAGGALMGGAIGAGAGAGADRFAAWRASRAASKSPNTAAQRYANAQDFGLDVGMGDVGGMSSKATERLLDVQPGAASVMQAGRNRLAEQLPGAVDNVAATFGKETSGRGIGETAQRGAKNWISAVEKKHSAAYDAIPIPADAEAVTGATTQVLEGLTNKITSNPKLGEIVTDKTLANYLEAFKSGGLSWNDMKQFRSLIGEKIGQQMFGENTLKSDLRALYGALSDDMQATATRQGPAAVRAFNRANDLYASSQRRIEGVITDLLGKDMANNPEAATAFIQTIAKGGRSSSDLKALAQVRKTLSPDEWGRVSNGMIRLMGQPAKSEGRDFNPQTFVKSYQDMGEGAKNILFGKSELRANLDKFVDVIGGIAENNGTRNSSNTAMGLAGLLSYGGAGGGLPGAAALATQAATSYGAAKLWTNPGFVRWATGYSKMLAGAAKGGVNPAAQKSQMAALSRLASSNPAIEAEVIDFAQHLAARAGSSLGAAPQRAAASGTENTTTERGPQ